MEISPDTLALHKQLVELFQDYEQLTKRIRDQPCEEGSGQWKLQQAIARASGLFISKEAGIIQVSRASHSSGNGCGSSFSLSGVQ
jgi:rabenosyn-5